MQENHGLVGTAYAAEKLDVDAKTVINWAKAGVIKGKKMGGLWKFPQVEIDRESRGEGWESINAVKSGGFASSSVAKKSMNRLTRLLEKKQKSMSAS